jgi:hypothetical protein
MSLWERASATVSPPFPTQVVRCPRFGSVADKREVGKKSGNSWESFTGDSVSTPASEYLPSTPDCGMMLLMSTENFLG